MQRYIKGYYSSTIIDNWSLLLIVYFLIQTADRHERRIVGRVSCNDDQLRPFWMYDFTFNNQLGIKFLIAIQSY